jgi:hypothetical protein
MIEPIDVLIKMNFIYLIDMFSFMSMAACANAIKYGYAYRDFDINAHYEPVKDTSPKFVLTEEYWNKKVDAYDA